MPPTGLHIQIANEYYGGKMDGQEVYAVLPDFVWYFIPKISFEKSHDRINIQRIKSYVESSDRGNYWIPELMYHHIMLDDIHDGEEGFLKPWERKIYETLSAQREFKHYPERLILDLAGILMDFSLDFSFFETEGHSIVEKLNRSKKNFIPDNLEAHLSAGYGKIHNENTFYDFALDFQNYDFRNITSVEGLIKTHNMFVTPNEGKVERNSWSVETILTHILGNNKKRNRLKKILYELKKEFSSYLKEIIHFSLSRLNQYKRESGFLLF
ncbi:MAG: hypothetical protein ISR95_08195 [Candidatus Marinimicrobia bacterium]|nr:hypothetical protein [Candidatus Neomarinimicrobiota bacterium]